MKLCTKCNTIKDESSFRTRGKSGKLQAWCKDCEYTWIKQWKKDNKEHIKNRDKQYYKKTRLHKWAYSTIYGHTNRGCEILFTVNELETIGRNTTHCRLCGNKLDYSGTDDLQTRPTMDIINSNDTILTLDRIQIICHRCNMSKGTMSEKEFIKYCNNIVKLHGDKYDIFH